MINLQRPRHVHALCEYVNRGVKYEEPVLITNESVVPDYSLIPKHLESNYKFSKTKSQKIAENVISPYTEFPPFLKDILIKNGVKDPKLKVRLTESPNSLYRLAKDGEQPTRHIETGFGTAKSPNLLKNVNYDI